MATTSEKTLIACLNARQPVMLIGAPGTTKTATIRALADEMKYDLITIVPSRMDAQDLSGFPTRGELTVVGKDGIKQKVPMTEYAPQYWQHEIMSKKRVILFLDEFSNAHPSVQASLLSFIQDRQFPNGEYFPEETILVGAMNPMNSAADGYELREATTNRLTFIAWKPDNESWLKGMLDNWGRGVRDEAEGNWRKLIVRFLSDEPGYIHKENDFEVATGESYGVDITDPSERSILQMSWASRRSWDNLSMILGGANKDHYTEDTLMKGTIGASATTGFRTWLAKHGALNVSSIIKDPRKYQGWDSLSMVDIQTVLGAACDGVNAKNIYNVIDIFRIVAENDQHSFAASFLGRFVGSHHKLTEITRPEREAIKKETMAVVNMYKAISENTHEISRRIPVSK